MTCSSNEDCKTSKYKCTKTLVNSHCCPNPGSFNLYKLCKISFVNFKNLSVVNMAELGVILLTQYYRLHHYIQVAQIDLVENHKQDGTGINN